MSITITCIKKDNGNHENPYVAISTLGWINDLDGKTGSSTREQVYDWVKNGGIGYVRDAYGNKAQLTAEISPKGTKYVKTKADFTKEDNLLKLPECK